MEAYSKIDKRIWRKKLKYHKTGQMLNSFDK